MTLTSNGDLIVSGYVNKTEQLSEVLGATKKFREKIAKGAFTKALRNKTRDIDFLAEHDNEKILASTRNGTLKLYEDDVGLYMEAVIAPTSWGQDYYTLIKEGLINSMSFGFRALKDSWEYVDGIAIRTVHELELYEVSVVKDPAYSQSNIQARGIDLIKDIEIPNLKEEERYDMKKIETRTNEFEKILRGEVRSLNTTADGGALIPEQVYSEIILKMEEVSPVFAKVRKIDSVIGTLRVARENDSVVAGFVGEGENILESAINFEHVDLKQKRVGAAITLSNQLLNDSAVNLQEYVQNLLARRVAKAVEKSILTGQGGVEFSGIINDADVQAIQATGTVTLDNLLDLYLAINPEFLNDASFIMQRDFFNQIAKLKDNNGHYFIQNGVVNGELKYTLFGLPVDITEALPADTPVVFGNFEEAYTVMVKKEAGIQEIVDSTQALRGSKLFVFDAYMDGAVVNPQAVAKLVIA